VTPTPETHVRLLTAQERKDIWKEARRREVTAAHWAYTHADSLLDALAASQERVRELEVENKALWANTSASVVRRLVEQGALRGPTTAEAEGERGLKQEGGVQD